IKVRGEWPEIEAGGADRGLGIGRDLGSKTCEFCPRHQNQIGLLSPTRFSEQRTGGLEGLVAEMQQRNRGVVLDRKITVRHADEYAASDARQFAHEGTLVLYAADMLQHRIGSGNIKRVVCERQRCVWCDLLIAHGGECALKILGGAEPA